MHTFFITFVSLLAILPLVLSTPIPAWSSTVLNEPAVDDEASQARVAAYHEADATAKEMVDKMVKVANSDKPEHQKIVNDAFGPNADREKIKAVIHNLDTKQTQIGTTDIAGVKAGLVATTPMPNRPDPPGGPIKLGPEFFAADASKEYRAGTLIHEATHQHSYTGDVINKDDRIVGALEKQKENIKLQDDGKPHIGYHFPGPPDVKKVPTSADDLSEKYKNNRDHVVKNMEDNADSYRVFAHLCSQPGVVARDIELFGRALMEADDDEYIYLTKRAGASCALPKDYFQKKAAAKAAAAGKATKSLEPSSHLTKGATKLEQASHLASSGRTSKTVASGLGSHMSTKSTKSVSHIAKGISERTSLASHGRTSQRGASGVKSHVSTKSSSPLSHLAKGTSTRTSRLSPKAGIKSALKAKGLGTSMRTSRLSPKAGIKSALKAKGASMRTSRLSPKAGIKSALKAKGSSMRTSRLSPKAGIKSALKAKGASMRTSRLSPKAGNKSALKTKGASMRTSRLSPKGAIKSVVKGKGASMRTSRLSPKAAIKSVGKAKGASMRTSRVSPKAAIKSVVKGASMGTSRATSKAAPKSIVNALKRTATQGKVSGVAKKVAVGLLKASKK